MKKFIAGYIACIVVSRNSSRIIKFLEDQIAKLQLRQDILRHDNPDLR